MAAACSTGVAATTTGAAAGAAFLALGAFSAGAATTGAGAATATASFLATFFGAAADLGAAELIIPEGEEVWEDILRVIPV